MAEELAADTLDAIRKVAPDVADGLERVAIHQRQKFRGNEEPGDEIPADYSFLLDFTYDGKKLTPAELRAVLTFVGNGFMMPPGDVIHIPLYTHPRVLAALHAVTEDAVKQFQINPNRVVRELSTLIGSNISDVMDIGPGGILVKDFSKLPREITAAVQEVQEVRNAQGTQIRVKLYDKVAAINTLCKLLGFNKEKTEVTVSVDVGNRLDAALQRLKRVPEPDAIEGELAQPALEAPADG